VVVTFTLSVPDDLARRLEAAAMSRGVSVETAVVEALTNWATAETMPELSFVGIGEGRPDLAESHADILAEHLRNAS
jgi:predicted transcriptional regulator